MAGISPPSDPVSPLSDPIHDITEPHVHWTTANIGEALPGVQTPLSWSLWWQTIERTTRETFRATGAFADDELPFPPHASRQDRIVQIFHGRACLRVDTLRDLGDRMPGTTGAQVVAGVFGEVPSTMSFSPTRRRYPHVIVGLTREHLTIPGRLRREAAATIPWWHERLTAVPHLDTPAACIGLFNEAAERFYELVLIQTIALFCAVQPMYDALTRLAQRAGLSDVGGLTSGYGGVPEAAMVGELWRCSRGELPLAEIVKRFGHHGPLEGELGGVVWREDDTPLRRMMEQYAAEPDDRNPALKDAERAHRRERLEHELLDGLPRAVRPVARKLITHAAKTIPLRGVAKDAFLQAFDVTRAAARRSGELYAADGTLADPGDVFYLTVHELQHGLPDDVTDVIAQRRAWREQHAHVRLPPSWQGTPKPITLGEADRVERLQGTGVSPGTVEGVARVVTDPTFVDVEPGEILVSATTDPSWASIMFLSSALVVDIGGHLSHAAVVARELGIPCVVNTVSGSDVLHTGDYIRVNGTTGTIEILRRSSSDASGPVSAQA